LGKSALGNVPGGREQATGWTDTDGNFWLFGGYGNDSQGYSAGYLNDLWEFNPISKEWTWVSGSSSMMNGFSPAVYGTQGVTTPGSTPGGRISASSWVDSNGKFWIFGGMGYDSQMYAGFLIDLWKFNPSTAEWTWMGGSNSIGSNFVQPGVYGTLGTPEAGNTPGGRSGASSWTDTSGNFWFFGGDGYDAQGNSGPLNDLWEFSPSIGQWTWMGGSNSLGNSFGQPGVYGTLGTPGTGNIPGGRGHASSWADRSGGLWLFGGSGLDANGNGNALNDLWKFNPATNQWAWMGGSSTIAGNNGQPGIYGTLGTPSAANTPGARYDASTWVDGHGSFWLFGGAGFDENDIWGSLNDLWKYQPSSVVKPTVTVTPSLSNMTAVQTLGVTIKVSGGGGNPTPTGWVALASGSYMSSGVTLIDGSATIDIPAGNLALGTDTLTANYTPDTAGASSYNGTMGSSSVAVTLSTPTVSLAPASYSVTNNQPLSVSIYVLFGYDGNWVPSGTVTLNTVGYNSPAVVLTPFPQGATATVTVPAGALSPGSYLFSATYWPDANSTSIYSNNTGATSQAVVVTAAPTAVPPIGWLDQAIDSATSSTTVGKNDSLLVQGWAADVADGAPLSNVTVYVDGTSIGTPTLGIARPDVAAVEGAAYLNSGYRMTYSAATLALGPHTVTVIAIDSGGRSTTFGPLAFTVAATAGSAPPSPPFGQIDSAIDSVNGSSTVGQSDAVVVGGWAADQVDGAPLSNVKVYIDGYLAGTPALGIARADVAAVEGSVYLNSGYRLTYSAATLALGSHAVTVTASDSGGRSTTFGPLAFTVAATAGTTPPSPPFGQIDSAVDSVNGSTTVGQSDTVVVGGWAADQVDGTPLSNVKVYIDGNLAGTPALGIARADVAAVEGAAYLNSGYRLTFSAATLALGSHAVTVIASDSGGRSTTFGPLAFTVAATAGSTPPSPPFGHLDSAVDSVAGGSTVMLADTVVVTGWAADKIDGAPLSNVTVYIDGNLPGRPTLGIARADVATVEGAAYLNSGFQMNFAVRTLGLGSHTVTVIAIDSGGLSTTFGPLDFIVQ